MKNILMSTVLISIALIYSLEFTTALRSTTTTTTSTTTTTTTESSVSDNGDEEQEYISSQNDTNSKLTGIPQIDYIWDPNLPRELNGYNLSGYPFFSVLPPREDIDFKCDGLHDGFYASIKFKCQIYHHCVYGIRNDFLCANYTAFDQKTFICHFASEVDCKNSHKYWHRNDDLYMATTTTSTTTTTIRPPPTAASRPYRRKRPLRRRPEDDYYDDEDEYDYIEERPRRRKQRPRVRRPDYDDMYEHRRTYFDDEYQRRPMRERDYDDEDDEYDRPTLERPRNRNRSRIPPARTDELDRKERQKPSERRYQGENRRLNSNTRRNNQDERLVIHDEGISDQETNRRHSGRKKIINERRQQTHVRNSNAEISEVQDIYEEPESIPNKPLVKPSAQSSSSLGSLFDKPRAPPRISRPVPLSAKRKFQYSTVKEHNEPEAQQPENNDYYEEIDEYKKPAKTNNQEKPQSLPRVQNEANEKSTLNSAPEYSDYDDVPSPFKLTQEQNLKSNKPSNQNKHNSRVNSHADEGDRSNSEKLNNKNKNLFNKNRADIIKNSSLKTNSRQSTLNNRNQQTQIESTVKNGLKTDSLTDSGAEDLSKINSNNDSEENTKQPKPIVRVVKRPFLPSRGGSPYLPRGLKPVGSGQPQVTTTTQYPQIDMGSTISGVRLLEHGVPIVRNFAHREELYSPYNVGVRTTTQQPQIHSVQKTSLEDIYENDYDVTLNDALNPTLKPLSINLRSTYGFTNRNNNNNNFNRNPYNDFNSDSYYSSSDIRSSSAINLSNSKNINNNNKNPTPRSSLRNVYRNYDNYDY